MFFLYLTVFINIAGFSMIFPLLPFYAEQFNASYIQIGFLAASHALASLIASPIMGSISDKFGRKPVLIWGLIGATFSMAAMGLANSLGILLWARIFHGIVAAAVMPTARAYVGDISSPKNRVAAMGKVAAAMAAGQILGPTFSSFFIGFTGTIHAPFFVASAICLINAVSVLSFLSESHQHKSHKLKFAHGFSSVFDSFKKLEGESTILFLILLVWAFTLSNNQVAIPLLVEQKFNLGAEHIGYFFTGFAIIAVVIQGFLLPKIIYYLGEKYTMIVGLLAMGTAILMMPFVPSVIMMGLSYALMGFGSALNRPTAEGIISRNAYFGQGVTMGVAQSYESVGRILGPLLGGVLFTKLIVLPFYFTAVVLYILGLITFVYLKISKNYSRSSTA